MIQEELPLGEAPRVWTDQEFAQELTRRLQRFMGRLRGLPMSSQRVREEERRIERMISAGLMNLLNHLCESEYGSLRGVWMDQARHVRPKRCFWDFSYLKIGALQRKTLEQLDPRIAKVL